MLSFWERRAARKGGADAVVDIATFIAFPLPRPANKHVVLGRRGAREHDRRECCVSGLSGTQLAIGFYERLRDPSLDMLAGSVNEP